MIIQPEGRKAQSSGALDSADYYIAPESVVHITAILREMYADPVLAVLREYSSNAKDAHVLAKTPEKPIEITLPTVLQPNAIFRDYGPGLNEDETRRVLYGYGASGAEKRSSNEYIGALGIGAKCGFAIASQFQYVIYHGGVKTTWACYLNDHDIGKADKLGCEPTEEPSGVAVIIPIKEDTQDKFIDHAYGSLFQYWDVKPVFTNPVEGRTIKPVPAARLSTTMLVQDCKGIKTKITVSILDKDRTYYRYSSEAASSELVMGDFVYPVLLDQLIRNGIDLETMGTALMRMSIKAPIGFLPLAPSRETLQYSTNTKKVLAGIYTAFLEPEHLGGLLDKEFSGVTKAMELHGLYKQVNVYAPGAKFKTKSLRGYTHGKGFNISASDRPANMTALITQMCSHYGDRGWQVECSNEVETDQKYLMYDDPQQCIVVFSSKKTLDPARFLPYINDTLKRDYNTRAIRIVGTGDLETLRQEVYKAYPWMDELPWVIEDTLTPCANVDDYLYRSYRRRSRYSNRGSRTQNKYSQHGRKVVEFKQHPKTVSNYGRQSANWEPVKVAKLDLDTGWFIRMDEFKPQTSCGSAWRPEDLQTFISKFYEAFPDQTRSVYGVRQKDIGSILADGGVLLDDGIKACLTPIPDDVVDCAVSFLQGDIPNRGLTQWTWHHVFDGLKRLELVLPMNTKISPLIAKLMAAKPDAEQLKRMGVLYCYGYRLGVSSDGLATVAPYYKGLRRQAYRLDNQLKCVSGTKSFGIWDEIVKEVPEFAWISMVLEDADNEPTVQIDRAVKKFFADPVRLARLVD